MNEGKITHVIFDVDGLLLDTEPIYTEVTQEIVGRYGKRFTWEIKGRMIGRNNHEAARILIDALELPFEPEVFLDMQTEMFNQRFPLAKPLPGAVELTRRLHEGGIPLGVATSSSRRLFELKISNHKEWFSLFHAVVTGDDPELKRSKPAPDIFLLAAKRLGAKPSGCLVFEDAPTGVAAAVSAGMKVVAVPDSNMDRREYEKANLVLNSLEEIEVGKWFPMIGEKVFQECP